MLWKWYSFAYVANLDTSSASHLSNLCAVQIAVICISKNLGNKSVCHQAKASLRLQRPHALLLTCSCVSAHKWCIANYLVLTWHQAIKSVFQLYFIVLQVSFNFRHAYCFIGDYAICDVSWWWTAPLTQSLAGAGYLVSAHIKHGDASEQTVSSVGKRSDWSGNEAALTTWFQICDASIRLPSSKN